MNRIAACARKKEEKRLTSSRNASKDSIKASDLSCSLCFQVICCLPHSGCFCRSKAIVTNRENEYECVREGASCCIERSPHRKEGIGHVDAWK